MTLRSSMRNTACFLRNSGRIRHEALAARQLSASLLLQSLRVGAHDEALLPRDSSVHNGPGSTDCSIRCTFLFPADYRRDPSTRWKKRKESDRIEVVRFSEHTDSQSVRTAAPTLLLWCCCSSSTASSALCQRKTCLSVQTVRRDNFYQV